MNMTVKPAVLCGEVAAIPSKSHVQRLMIAAALSDAPLRILCPSSCGDIDAAVCCLASLGAAVRRDEEGFTVYPIEKKQTEKQERTCVLNAGASGAVLRFLLPVAAMLGKKAVFLRSERLSKRPMEELLAVLHENGVTVRTQENGSFFVEGKLKATSLSVTAKASSQFAGGCMFALAAMEGERQLHVKGKVNSEGYLDMTAEVLRAFSLCVEKDSEEDGIRYTLRGTLHTPDIPLTAEGDWSAASPFLCAGAIGSAPVCVSGLRESSLQPDRALADILMRFGAGVTFEGNRFTVSPGLLHGIECDISGTPDLLPALSLVAACAEGKTTVHGVARLRGKESDRVESVCRMLASLGGEAEADGDGMTIHGTGLSGGNVSSMGDHRIAMAASVACVAASEDITVEGAQTVKKSYPGFFEDLSRLTVDFDAL